MKVFINPGHGGNDSGAVGYGLREANVALAIGRRVEKYLQSAGVIVKLFQYDGLQEICSESNNWLADLFVSIHCNAANTLAKGTETFCYYSSHEGRKLASSIHNSILATIPELLDRGVKERGFYVIANTNAPAVLVETAFIDNAGDNQILRERGDDFAFAIATGILHYAGISKPLPDVIDSRVCPYCGNFF